MNERNACVYLVDDRIDELGPLARRVEQSSAVKCAVLHPKDIGEDHLRQANLVIVDFTLEDWDSRNKLFEIGLKPINGIAMIGVLRELSREVKSAPPTGFALITGRPGYLGDIVEARRPHVVSRLNNLEWYFEKKLTTPEDVDDTSGKIASLARAIAALPSDVVKDLQPIKRLVEFLGRNPNDEFFDRYCDAVQRCRPPLHHLSEWSHGLAVIRWLLHRILPYAAFLFDSVNLALRLRVHPSWLTESLTNNDGLAHELAPFQYTGPLSDFDRPRWWRDGIEQWLWDWTDGNSADGDAVWKLVESAAGASPNVVRIKRPVISQSPDWQRDHEFVSIDDVRRLKLDDWPDYADPPYTRISVLDDNPQLKMYVVE